MIARHKVLGPKRQASTFLLFWFPNFCFGFALAFCPQDNQLHRLLLMFLDMVPQLLVAPGSSGLRDSRLIFFKEARSAGKQAGPPRSVDDKLYQILKQSSRTH